MTTHPVVVAVDPGDTTGIVAIDAALWVLHANAVSGLRAIPAAVSEALAHADPDTPLIIERSEAYTAAARAAIVGEGAAMTVAALAGRDWVWQRPQQRLAHLDRARAALSPTVWPAASGPTRPHVVDAAAHAIAWHARTRR